MGRQKKEIKEAIRKLQLVKELNLSAYVYGATGFGKTNTVQNVFGRDCAQWISADMPADALMQALRSCEASRSVVIDDLRCLDSECAQEEIRRMIGDRGFCMVLIGRAATPSWLSQLVLQSRMIVVTENDLRVTEDELSAMCESAGVQASPEQIRSMLESTEGNAMVLDLLVRQLRKDLSDYEDLTEHIRSVFKSYLDEQIIIHWPRDIQNFLMQLCVVDAFTLALAEHITGDDSCGALLSRANGVGNILSCTEGIWQIRPVLRETLRERALKVYGRRRYNQLLYHAGRYYELNGDVLRALSLYEKCEEQDSIHSLLVREARNHPGAGNYWELRSYYQALSEQVILQEPVLMAAVSVLYSVLMNTDKSEYWYDRLKEYADHARGNDRTEAIAQLAYLEVGLPHRGTKDMIRILKAMPAVFKNSSMVLRPVSLTNNQPSIMNGSKDFCEWSKTDIVLANTLGPFVEKLLGRTGIGLSQIALGESAYEKGRDPYTVLNHLTKGQNQSENNGVIEMTWVSIALQARLAVCTGDMDFARRLAEGMLRRRECAGRNRMLDAIRAFQCWLRLYTNETGDILAWLTDAPDETIAFCTLNRYLYMVKIYCYIALGMHTPAITLIQRMLAYADYSDRVYIRMDCQILNAVIMRRNGEEWKDAFVQTLRQAAGFDFVRIISEKGAAVLPLLNEVKTSFCQSEPQLADWFSRVRDDTAQIARRYPDYLKGFGIALSDFSDAALQVLRLQAAGFTTGQIAEQLHISQRTVKYHAAENYRKLDAKNLVDAVQIAQTLHIL